MKSLFSLPCMILFFFFNFFLCDKQVFPYQEISLPKKERQKYSYSREGVTDHPWLIPLQLYPRVCTGAAQYTLFIYVQNASYTTNRAACMAEVTTIITSTITTASDQITGTCIFGDREGTLHASSVFVGSLDRTGTCNNARDNKIQLEKKNSHIATGLGLNLDRTQSDIGNYDYDDHSLLIKNQSIVLIMSFNADVNKIPCIIYFIHTSIIAVT